MLKKRVRYSLEHSYAYYIFIKNTAQFCESKFLSKKDAHNILFDVNERLQDSI